LLQKTIPEIWDDAMQKERQVLSQQRGIEGKHSIKQKDEIFDSMMIEFIVYHPCASEMDDQGAILWMDGPRCQKSFCSSSKVFKAAGLFKTTRYFSLFL
jgi:hypothetical protein